MKKTLKIILVFLLSIVILGLSKNVKANSINNISMDIFIDNKGDATVTEIWTCSTNQGTEVYHPYYNLGKSEIKSGGNKRPAILADSVEAVIAAIFIDGGLEPARKFIIENLKEEIEIATKHVGEKDYKTVLQEELQKNGDVKIEYTIIKESGPDHNKLFEAEVALNGKVLATGKGKSKKEAEMQAAKKALEN